MDLIPFDFLVYSSHKTSTQTLVSTLKLNNSFGSFAIPKEVFFVNALPKTRSGKITRRILRIMLNKSNPKSLNECVKLISSLKK